MEQLIQKPVKRNILLNPGPSTTTDTVKYAQVVPDICPREKEFGGLMKGLREDLVKIVHGDLEKYTSVLFCGSGTINIDACISSLLPEGGKGCDAFGSCGRWLLQEGRLTVKVRRCPRGTKTAQNPQNKRSTA